MSRVSGRSKNGDELRALWGKRTVLCPDSNGGYCVNIYMLNSNECYIKWLLSYFWSEQKTFDISRKQKDQLIAYRISGEIWTSISDVGFPL